MARKTLLLCVPLFLTALAGLGCTTAVKEGVGIARGAKGLYAPIMAVSPDKSAKPLGQYRYFELATLSDDFGGNVPDDLMMYLRAAFAEQLAEAEIPQQPGGKTLLIRGKILHYEDSSTLGLALGPIEEVVARIELVDKDSGKVIGLANCIGRTTSRVNVGVAKKGQGLAKAIVSWIASRYPEQDRK